MIVALLVLGAVAVFVNLIAIIVMLLLLVQSVRDARDTLTLQKINTSRLGGMEKILVAIHTMLVSEIAQANAGSMGPPMPPPGMGWAGIQHRGGKFVTEDGRHEADTFEELIQKLSSDPRYRVAKDEDVDKLREQFEDHAREHGEYEEDEEDENEGEEWKDTEDGS